LIEKEFISKWTVSLSENGIKAFPEDFLGNMTTEEIKLPGRTLVIGEEFFGNYEILTVDGTAVLQAESQYKAKYIVYSNRKKNTSVKIPVRSEDIKTAVAKYENYLDSIIKEIEADYKKSFPGEKRSNDLTNEIFRVLSLNRY
jgi:hypothetical protein